MHPDRIISQRGSPQILILDDYLDILYTIDILLHCFGYRPISTNCSQTAIDLIDEIEPSLVILDVDMPKIDGLKFIEIVRQKHSLKTMPILIFTALNLSTSQNRSKSGANALLRKSATPQELLAKVRDLLGECQNIT